MNVVPLSQPSRVSSHIRTAVDEKLRCLVGTPYWNQLTITITMDQVRKLKGGKIPYSLQPTFEKIQTVVVETALKRGVSLVTHSQGIVTAGALGGHLVAGPSAAFAPWLTALSVYRDYSGVVNKNDLHDVCPQLPNRQSQFRCVCAREDDGRTECDNAITWLISRSETDLCVKAVSFMLAGLPAAGQAVYRKVRKQVQKNRIVRVKDSVYISPLSNANWQPDATNCSSCKQPISSAFTTGADRHHCRVCGENFCGDCCSIRTELLNPLSKSGHETGVKNDQLICNPCVLAAKAFGKQIRRYEDGPHRRATTLKKNALPKSAGQGGCPRALAALYAIFGGCTTGMFWALLARDGSEEIVRRLKM